jgi:hypothetical protein
VGTVISRAAAPLGEERILKVFLTSKSESNSRFCPRGFL